MMQYPTINACQAELFAYIRTRMATDEPAPHYEGERSGLERLESIFTFMQRDEYDSILAKAAYLFCSVIDGHHFSNGNKRLAVTLLVYFLLINRHRISAPDMSVMRQALQDVFPHMKWHRVKSFRHEFEFFFYHLALIIADRQQKGKMTFQQEQEAVKELLRVVTVEV